MEMPQREENRILLLIGVISLMISIILLNVRGILSSIAVIATYYAMLYTMRRNNADDQRNSEELLRIITVLRELECGESITLTGRKDSDNYVEIFKITKVERVNLEKDEHI